MKLFFNFFLII